MSFEEALAVASRDEGFKATVYAMNTLLIRKGVYTQEEFQLLCAPRRSVVLAILFAAVNSNIAGPALTLADGCGGEFFRVVLQ